MTERSPQSNEKYSIRFTDGLRDQIKASAAENNRTMNAEIIARLEASGETLRDKFAMIAPPLDMDFTFRDLPNDVGMDEAVWVKLRLDWQIERAAAWRYYWADQVLAYRKRAGA